MATDQAGERQSSPAIEGRLGNATSDRWCAVAALALLTLPAGAAADGARPEPTIVEVQQAAARVAGGDASEDRSRVSRARASHWAPVLRGLLGGKDDSHFRDGVYRDTPLHWNDKGASFTWGISATWDLPQAIYARDEAQLSHAHLHLARARLQAAAEAARLFLDRREKRRALDALAADQAAARARLLLEIVRLTAELDARTAGLFRGPLEREEAESAEAAERIARAPRPPPSGTNERVPAPPRTLPEKR